MTLSPFDLPYSLQEFCQRIPHEYTTLPWKKILWCERHQQKKVAEAVCAAQQPDLLVYLLQQPVFRELVREHDPLFNHTLLQVYHLHNDDAMRGMLGRMTFYSVVWNTAELIKNETTLDIEWILDHFEEHIQRHASDPEFKPFFDIDRLALAFLEQGQEDNCVRVLGWLRPDQQRSVVYQHLMNAYAPMDHVLAHSSLTPFAMEVVKTSIYSQEKKEMFERTFPHLMAVWEKDILLEQLPSSVGHLPHAQSKKM